MNGDGLDEPGRPRGREPRRPHRSSRPLWLGGMPQSGTGAGCARGPDDVTSDEWEPGEDSMCCDACDRPHDPDTCRHCADVRGAARPGEGASGFDGDAHLHGPDGGPGVGGLGVGGLGGEGDPEPDLGEIVVILLVSTLAGLRDRLERDGFQSAAGLVHDLVEVADDYVMRFQP